MLPPKLVAIAEKLLADSQASKTVSLDEMGEAIGLVPVSADDVDALMTELEKSGRRVVGPEGARGAGNLQRVIPAARTLIETLGRAPTVAELAAETGLGVDDVRHALALGRVMGR